MKLTKEAMKALGFQPMMPNGNPKEPWWESAEMDMTFFEMPTRKEFFDAIADRAANNARQDIARAIRKALML
jgi:hypothetical protein